MKDWSSPELRNVPMNKFYEAQRVLMNGIIYTPRQCRYSQLEEIARDFKPQGQGEKSWLSECMNAVIHGYVNDDNVFRRAQENKKDLTQEQHETVAMLRGLDHIMRHGQWTGKYIELLNLDEKDEHEEGGV